MFTLSHVTQVKCVHLTDRPNSSATAINLCSLQIWHRQVSGGIRTSHRTDRNLFISPKSLTYARRVHKGVSDNC